MMNVTEFFESCPPSADGAFGPAVQGCRDDFDFTLAFEDYFFSIVPSAIFLLLAPVRVQQLFSKRQRVHGDTFKYTKVAILGIFAFLQLTLTLLWATRPQARAHGPSTAAAACSFAATLALCCLSPLEHSKSIRPSALINAYLFVSLIFDAVMLRTLWLTSPFSATIRDVFTASFALKSVILVQEAFEKRRFLQAADKAYGPETTSGLYGKALFWWLNGLIRRGFRQVLTPNDLYPIDQAMESETIDAKFWKTWSESSYQGKHKLVVVILQTLKWPLLIPILPRLVLMAFTYCQPLLVTRFLDYLQSDDDSNVGRGLIGAYVVVYFGIAISNGFYEYQLYRSLTMIRGLLVSAIYKKTTEISITAIDNKASLTLMSADVEQINRGLRQVNELWASFIEFGLATYLLEWQIGPAAVAPFFVVVIAVAVSVRASAFAKAYQGAWFKKIQKRIGITSSMLGSMKGIKMAGLTDRLSLMTQGLRVEEVSSAGPFRMLIALLSSIAYIPQLLAPVVTFAVFAIVAAKDHETLDATRLFTSLSLLLLLTQPMFFTFQGIVGSVSTIGCFERIGKYIQADSRLDYRFVVRRDEPTQSDQVTVPRELGSSSSAIELVQVPTIGISKPMKSILSDRKVITVQDGTFGWNVADEPVLRDVNLTITESEMTMIIGPVGCGKSTLCKALLGEVPCSKGFIYVPQLDVSFCDQTPWLTNTSVQKNITGFSRLDQDKYNLVIHACDLENDIRILPNGHDTLVGSKGISLSGGQKQRVALARSLYASKDIAILDDIFGGLDKTTSKNIFDRVFGRNGLLRKWGTTIILVTHSVNLLPQADHIIALNADGQIAEQGSFNTLNARNGYVHNFFLEHVHDQEQNDDTTNEVTTKVRAPTKPTAPVSAPADKKRQTGDIATYHYLFKRIGWSTTITWLILEAFLAFFFTFPTIWLKWWTDVNSSGHDQQTGLYLGVYAVFQVSGILSNALMVYYSLNIMAATAGLKLHETTLNTVMAAPLAFFTKTDTGSLTNRFSQDMQLIDGSLPLSLMMVVNALFLCVGQAILIATASVYIAIAFPALIAVYFIIQRYYLRTSRQLRLLDIEQKAPVYTQFLQSLSGLATIRAFGWQRESIAQNHDLLDRSQRPFYLLFMVQRWLTLVLDLINTALAVLVVAVASHLRGHVSVGFTGVSLTQIISFTASMKLFILFWTQLENSLGAVTRIKNFEAETQNENLARETADVPENWPSSGRIEIKDLSATYDSSSASQTLSNINLAVSPGQKLAIVGRTGSGKTSLLLTLLRLLDPSTGNITIDGHSLFELPRQTIRSRLNVISQDPFFLHGTIRLNLDPYNNHIGSLGDETLQKALEEVGLWSILSTRVDRAGSSVLDAELEEDMLSHGQRQLFCLARAILRKDKGKVLILDEATASLDQETDSKMQGLIRRHFAGSHTIVAVAHKLETIQDFDVIVVMNEGQIVERGGVEELLGKKGSGSEGPEGKAWFRELWESDRKNPSAVLGTI